MTISRDLIENIKTAIGAAVSPSLDEESDLSDLFEAYVFSILIDAAKQEDAIVCYNDVDEKRTNWFEFRTSPGYIFSKNRPYTHAVIEFENTPILEAHMGVRIAGKSGVLHECDIAVLWGAEATSCRAGNAIPRHTGVLLAVECKFYSSNIPLNLGRSFMGFSTEITPDSHFVVNTTSGSVGKMLNHYGKYWHEKVNPDFHNEVQRLSFAFQTSFRNFKTKHRV